MTVLSFEFRMIERTLSIAALNSAAPERAATFDMIGTMLDCFSPMRAREIRHVEVALYTWVIGQMAEDRQEIKALAHRYNSVDIDRDKIRDVLAAMERSEVLGGKL